MQEPPTINNWEEFEPALAELNAEIEKLKKYRQSSQVTEPLFRGQADFDWPLETTLERYVKKEISLLSYYKTILVARPQIETFTDPIWNIPNFEKYKQWVNTELKPNRFSLDYLAAYDYMIYLRHNGFPSPLLDWTKSPYVAAFFAYRDIAKGTKNVSMYAYIDDIGLGKSNHGNKPWILSLGAYVKTHKRHFLQQSSYTVCLKEQLITPGNDDDYDYYYSNHEKVFSENRRDQDTLYKFKLPTSERINFLKKLDSMNINALHSSSKCNKRGSCFEWSFKAQTLPGPVID